MAADHLLGIEQFEADLWKVADNLRANSNLASNEYFMPILGLIFLRQATNRYNVALAEIDQKMASGAMPERELIEADFASRRALRLPEDARYDTLLEKRKDGGLGAAVTAAMDAVEERFPPLAGQLPKDYQHFEDDVLEDMMRTFDSEALRVATGDVFGSEPFATQGRDPDPLAESWEELVSTQTTVFADIMAFTQEIDRRASEWKKSGNGERRSNADLHTLRQNLHDAGERCRNLTREIDLAAKLVGRVVDTAVKELEAQKSEFWNNKEIGKARKSLENAREKAVESLRLTRYFIRQADWLQERFPDAELCDVEGLVKLVDRGEIEAHDWSLTPGRYVGVAPEEEDEDFDFGEALRSIHVDLKGLNEEAVELAARIEKNFKELGV